MSNGELFFVSFLPGRFQLDSNERLQAFVNASAIDGLERSQTVESSSVPGETDLRAGRQRSSGEFHGMINESNIAIAADGRNRTYSNPQLGKQTEFIERALSDTPRTADELAIIATLSLAETAS